MKKILALSSFLLLAACQTNPTVDAKVVTQYKYIIVKVPNEMMALPQSPKVPVENVTDKEVAQYMLDLYEMSGILESQILAIKDYQDKRVESVKKTIKVDDIIEKE
jgi:hypothetical protein